MNGKHTWTSLVPFFLRAGPLKATFEHHTGRRGADRCFEEGRVDITTRLRPETNGNTPQRSIHTRDLQRLYTPCGADERAQRRTVVTVAVEVVAYR